MYTIKDTVYANAGYLLHGRGITGFSSPADRAPFTETAIDITDFTYDGTTICFGEIRWLAPGLHSYAEAKKYFIGKRYSNDDQIAIILNKDDSEEDALAFEKMQEWREWSSVMAHKVMEIINTE